MIRLNDSNILAAKEISISYAITVYNEIEEIQNLIPFLIDNKQENDEIVVLWDNKGPKELLAHLRYYEQKFGIKVYEDTFNNHFADWKNKLTSYCKGNYIYQIDADELPNEVAFDNLHWIFKANSEVDVFLVPRINIVKNLGLSWKNKWGWQCYAIKDQIQEKIFNWDNERDRDEYALLQHYGFIIEENGEDLNNKQVKFYTPRVNGHDWQWRIYKNNSKIRWKNKVHEQLEGYSQYSFLPTDIGYDLLHIKSLERQIKQNSYYETL